MKKLSTNTKYDPVINFLAEKMEMFSTDHLRLLVEAKSLEPVKDSRDWSRVLRSAASRGLCKKTDQYQKSNFRGNNTIPRALWCRPEEGGAK